MKKYLPILIVLIFGLLAGRTLFTPGYFNMHDDLQMMRQLEMEKCFLDGQIPCRWVPDMGYGYGFPLFNFYPPLPYLIGEIFRVVGFSFIDTAKFTFALSFVVSGITMYLLAKEFFGKAGGVVSSIFYVWAPYHSVDVYVRGAMNEAWALAFFPLIFLFSYKLIKTGKGIIPLAFAYTGLLMSHNLMVMIFTPLFGLWCLIFILRENKWKIISRLLASGVLALGLAAFFTIPAVVEQKLVRVDTLIVGYYEYIAHFASLNQLLFSRFWGYGPSIWGDNDGMPFPAGNIHWIVSIVVGVASVYFLFKLKKKKEILKSPYFIILFFILSGWFALFMAHSRSTPIWQAIKPLEFVQFPWRFLTIVTLSFSFIAGSMVLLMRPFGRLRVIVPSLLAILLVAINWNYFLPLGGKMGELTDEEKFNSAAWDLQRTAGIYDYLPKSAVENPKDGQNVLAEIIEGNAELSEMKQGTDWASFRVRVKDTPGTIRVNIFAFPNWKAFRSGQEIQTYVDTEERWGRMYIDIPRGSHDIYLKLFNTPIRTLSNIISVITWFLLLTFPIWRKKINAVQV